MVKFIVRVYQVNLLTLGEVYTSLTHDIGLTHGILSCVRSIINEDNLNMPSWAVMALLGHLNVWHPPWKENHCGLPLLRELCGSNLHHSVQREYTDLNYKLIKGENACYLNTIDFEVAHMWHYHSKSLKHRHMSNKHLFIVSPEHWRLSAFIPSYHYSLFNEGSWDIYLLLSFTHTSNPFNKFTSWPYLLLGTSFFHDL